METTEGSTTSPLDIAAERTRRLLRRRLPGESNHVIAETVAAIVRMLKAGDGGEEIRRGGGGGSILPVAARTFATELVRYWRERDAPPKVEEVLRCLDALQRLEAPVAPAPEDWGLNQTAPALDLVVEFAHDLRSPLTSILFLSETLRRAQHGALDPVQHRQIGIIYSAALNMVSLASDVIDLARGGDRLMDRRPTQFSIRETLDSLCDIVAPLVEEKKVSIRTVAPPVDVRLGNPVALSRILLNLLSNALRFTSEGYVEIIAHPVDAVHVEFSIRDTGSGYESERDPTGPHLDSSQDANRRFGFAGSGLGLTICRRLLAAMGSELHHESAPGWGTRFYFRLYLPHPEIT